MMINVVIAEGKENFRESIKNLILTQPDINVVGIGKDGYEAIKLTETHHPDIVLLDSELPLLDGIKVSNSLKIRAEWASTILISEKIDENGIIKSVRNGITGFVLRQRVMDEICPAVRLVKSGGSFMSTEIAKKTFDIFSRYVKDCNSENSCLHIKEGITFKPLPVNKVELQLVKFIGLGLSNKEIAELLMLKETTIRNYISLILQKTGLEHRTQIAIYAINNGFANKKDLLIRKSREKHAYPRKVAQYPHAQPSTLFLQ
ncbi:DNA-binding response regulator [Spirochaetia bacterium]|nr:DNA-binding response regulator [Spirochaetia bacterium]